MKGLGTIVIILLSLCFTTIPCDAEVKQDLFGGIVSICGGWMMNGDDIQQQAVAFGLSVKRQPISASSYWFAGFFDEKNNFSIDAEKIVYPDAETKICTVLFHSKVVKSDFLELQQRLAKDKNFGPFLGDVLSAPSHPDSAHAYLKLPGSNPHVTVVFVTGDLTSLLTFTSTNFSKVN